MNLLGSWQLLSNENYSILPYSTSNSRYKWHEYRYFHRCFHLDNSCFIIVPLFSVLDSVDSRRYWLFVFWPHACRCTYIAPCAPSPGVILLLEKPRLIRWHGQQFKPCLCFSPSTGNELASDFEDTESVSQGVSLLCSSCSPWENYDKPNSQALHRPIISETLGVESGNLYLINASGDSNAR